MRLTIKQARLATVAVAITGIGTAALVVALGGSASLSSGPLDPGVSTGTGFVVSVGRPFTFGGMSVRNDADHVAVLEKLEFVGLSPHAEVRRAGAALTGRDMPAAIGTWRSWPPPNTHVRPLQGFRIPALGVAQILVEPLAPKAGEYYFQAAELTYRIDRRRYRVLLPDAFRWCAGIVGTCAAPDA